MIDRVIQIRKTTGLSQEKFAERLNLSRNFINQLENGKMNLSDRTISDICRVFNVNEEWLRHGTGEMFKNLSHRDAGIFSELLEESTPFYDLIKDIMETYMTLDDKSKSALDIMIKELYEKIRKKEG